MSAARWPHQPPCLTGAPRPAPAPAAGPADPQRAGGAAPAARPAPRPAARGEGAQPRAAAGAPAAAAGQPVAGCGACCRPCPGRRGCVVTLASTLSPHHVTTTCTACGFWAPIPVLLRPPMRLTPLPCRRRAASTWPACWTRKASTCGSAACLRPSGGPRLGCSCSAPLPLHKRVGRGSRSVGRISRLATLLHAC